MEAASHSNGSPVLVQRELLETGLGTPMYETIEETGTSQTNINQIILSLGFNDVQRELFRQYGHYLRRGQPIRIKIEREQQAV